VFGIGLGLGDGGGNGGGSGLKSMNLVVRTALLCPFWREPLAIGSRLACSEML